MGSKIAGEGADAERPACPIVPGYHGEDQSRGALAQAAERIGYPVLVKASAGGGGKGMRVVRARRRAGRSARRRAGARPQRAFGDDRVLD